MMCSDIPTPVKSMMASSNMRWRHRYWHLVKNANFVNDPANASLVLALADIGWTASLTGQPGSGLDFLFMHRMMIKNIDAMLANANDAAWPKVVGWSQIPSGANDVDWPEPEIENLDDPTQWPAEFSISLAAISNARSEAVVAQNLEYERILRSTEFLQRDDISLDVYGDVLESSVHNWMHMRFADHPPADFNDESIDNDWLGAPFSSHVNSYFWKLHGWIDDCIGLWETANNETADFSNAWRPPEEAPPWNQLNLDVEILGLAETKSRAPLFDPIAPFQSSPESMESVARMLKD
ncbi:hypothetical protein [Kiloniella antarctica]|uniref:Tyrosinase copper-binding domain-containing protein n=1 Tax=Kiloniella antarctica TaxID=1550907 RepID=A0ABW5BNE9_9PROT